jgi:hypothetical protein
MSNTKLHQTNSSSNNALNQNQQNNNSINNNINNNSVNINTSQPQQQQQQQPQQQIKKGIIISPDGQIKNVPPSMLLDQFGIVGLLAYLRSADKEKDFFALALGTDLTGLGLNLNSNE